MSRFQFLRYETDVHSQTLHAWVTDERAAFWGQVGQSLTQVREHYKQLCNRPSYEVWLGYEGGTPLFLVERYDPAHDAISTVYPVRRGDVGMHFLVSTPSGQPCPGLTTDILVAIVEWLFADPSCERIVVEPDVHNHRVQRLNRKVGFVPERTVELPEKRALLSFCDRLKFARATRRTEPTWLTPERFQRANLRLLGKLLAEFSHECLVEPSNLMEDQYELVSPSGRRYQFTAQILPLEHWSIDPLTIHVYEPAGHEGTPETLECLIDFREQLGIPPEALAGYLEEVSGTLSRLAFCELAQTSTVAELLDTQGPEGFQAIEAAMSEGHPCFIANSGRGGFTPLDTLRYAPEAGASLRLLWVAAAADCVTFCALGGLDYDTLLAGELSEQQRQHFDDMLTQRGVDPRQYLLLPVHPWQWERALATAYAGDIAAGSLILLGEGSDAYQPQQSLRTLFNRTHPNRHYVKTALSVLNMGFSRGLSSHYMRTTPAINEWLSGIIEADCFLRSTGARILREVAAIGYYHPLYERVGEPGDPHRKLLAALWRESPMPHLSSGQKVMTMASLLHRDHEGTSVVGELIERSGVGAHAWLSEYVRAYLHPLLHLLVRHEIALMPHGENIILVLENYRPVSIFIKDIGEEIGVLGEGTVLPQTIARILHPLPEQEQIMAIFCDIFDSFFRFLSDILHRDRLMTPQQWWNLVASEVRAYQQEAKRTDPTAASRLDRYDFFAPSFERSCLNRLQLRNHRQMLDLSDPTAALVHHGRLANPLYRDTGGVQEASTRTVSKVQVEG